jgi:hypothetical protein
MRVVLLVLAAFLPASAILYNIDQPVPISLAHAEYYVSARLWGEGGMMMRFGIGLFDRVTLGMSYGGNYIIGALRPGSSGVPGAACDSAGAGLRPERHARVREPGIR